MKRRPMRLPTAQSVARMLAANKAFYADAFAASKALLSHEINSRGQMKTVKTMSVKEQYL